MCSFLNRFSQFYRYFIVIATVFLFYSNVPNYLFRVDLLSISPKIYLYALMLLILPLFFAQKVLKDFFNSPLLIWLVVYLAIAVIWFLLSSQSEEIQLVFSARIATIVFLVSILFILTENNRSIAIARWTILVCVLVSVVNNLYEITHPFSFIPLGHELSNPGRAAGFYMNANQAGAAMILGMIITVGLFSKYFRAPYALFVFIGVLTTLSRAAIIGWFIVVCIFISQKTIRKRECLVGIAIVALMGIFLTPILVDFLFIEKGVNIGNVIERFEWFMNLGQGSIDGAQEERQVVARLSWDLFANHPIFGNGIGSTEIWSENVSTHNMYLYLMADYGIIGALLMPCLVLSVIWFSKFGAPNMAIPFAIFMLFWGFFSHNILSERYILISIALISSVYTKSYSRIVETKEIYV